MADSLYELLTPYLDQQSGTPKTSAAPSHHDATTNSYLNRMTTLPLQSLTSTEPASLSQSSLSVIRSLQALSKRSHRSVISATNQLSHLSSLLPSLASQSAELHQGLPAVETAATAFASKYERNSENVVLDRRKKAMLLSRNVDRVSDILDLPTLLATTINSSSAAATQGTGGVAASGYASALDLHAHVKRLRALYPESALIADITKQSDEEIQNLITVLINGLQNPNLKLAGAMRMVGWLRRVAPDLATRTPASTTSEPRNISLGAALSEGSLGALFLICRLGTLRRTLDALDPLRELADQESIRRKEIVANGQQRWVGGAQTERFLKRWIELFREQSFNIVSMYKSIFPSALPTPGSVAEVTSPGVPSPTHVPGMSEAVGEEADWMEKSPSVLATFAPHLVDMLSDVLRAYMPNVSERPSRESLLTQVLYCAGSLGRQGVDFSMMLALLEDELHDGADIPEEDEEQDPEWVQVMKKHRVQASRLELLASGVGSGRKASTPTNS
ncbi:hypothetical protein AAFC00_004326 [Neodothiora populina]|uniref:Conserved oligomeric Golgi complex subunit 8 n=1 Tax=Neodothiora populina TaxID=2781224 RepID=A0ABR3PKH8_9PEZI